MVSYNQKGKGDIKWQDVLTLIVDTTGRKRESLIPLATTMTPGPRLANTMRRMNNMATKTIEFYFDDLNEDAQKRFMEFLGGENGNYDVIPFCVMEDDEPEEENEDED